MPKHTDMHGCARATAAAKVELRLKLQRERKQQQRLRKKAGASWPTGRPSKLQRFHRASCSQKLGSSSAREPSSSPPLSDATPTRTNADRPSMRRADLGASQRSAARWQTPTQRSTASMNVVLETPPSEQSVHVAVRMPMPLQLQRHAGLRVTQCKAMSTIGNVHW